MHASLGATLQGIYAPLQRIEMGQSTDLTPLVSLLFSTFLNPLQFLRNFLWASTIIEVARKYV